MSEMNAAVAVDAPVQSSNATYQMFISQVATKVRELEMEHKQLSEKLPAKLDDIFEPTIKIKIGTNEIAALCDLGASVSTIPKNLFEIGRAHV